MVTCQLQYPWWKKIQASLCGHSLFVLGKEKLPLHTLVKSALLNHNCFFSAETSLVLSEVSKTARQHNIIKCVGPLAKLLPFQHAALVSKVNVSYNRYKEVGHPKASLLLKFINNRMLQTARIWQVHFMLAVWQLVPMAWITKVNSLPQVAVVKATYSQACVLTLTPFSQFWEMRWVHHFENWVCIYTFNTDNWKGWAGSKETSA